MSNDAATICRGRPIVVAGAGIFGLWQAVALSAAGHRVRLVERSAAPFTASASRLAGAMLAPFCEAEASDDVVVELGLQSMAIWKAAYPGIEPTGTLVVAPARDRAELLRFARMTRGHVKLYPESLARLEPELAGRFPAALHFPDEAYMDPLAAMRFLLELAERQGVQVSLGSEWSVADLASGELLIDCRGLGARADLPALRGVRGERILVRSNEVKLTHMVRLLHPRHPLYVVPWAEGVYMIGATVIESDDDGPVTVRSALELLGAAYAVHPGFAEAEVVDLGAGVRPALPDNMPRAYVSDRIIRVNGAYRHGFLLAPLLAHAVRDFIASGVRHPELMRDG